MSLHFIILVYSYSFYMLQFYLLLLLKISFFSAAYEERNPFDFVLLLLGLTFSLSLSLSLSFLIFIYFFSLFFLIKTLEICMYSLREKCKINLTICHVVPCCNPKLFIISVKSKVPFQCSSEITLPNVDSSMAWFT